MATPHYQIINDKIMSDELAIISHYGINNQLKKLSEECFELIEAVLKYEYGAGYSEVKAKEHICEELADCHVLLSQIQEFYNIEPDALRKEYDYKITRQLARIMNEKKEL